MSADGEATDGLEAAEKTPDWSRESLRVIFNASSEGMTFCRLIRDAAGVAVDYQVLDVNPAHAVLTGATREAMLTLPVKSIAPPVDPRWITSAESAVRTGQPQQFDVPSPTTGRWLDIRVSPVVDDFFVQTFIDVTARHEAEALRAELLAEMNHRVKNNFQMVAAILELQARSTQAPEVREQLRSAVQRVHVLAELHASLAPDADIEMVEVDVYLRTLCGKLAASIHDPRRIRLRVDAAPARLPTTRVLPLGFVISELVTNAIKYAFPGAATGEIIVSFGVFGDGYRLSIADNGVGMPTAAAGRGLGTRLVRAFVAQAGGKLSLKTAPGVTYEVILA